MVNKTLDQINQADKMDLEPTTPSEAIPIGGDGGSGGTRQIKEIKILRIIKLPLVKDSATGEKLKDYY